MNKRQEAISDALDEIRDPHIAEAARGRKKRRRALWISGLAAVLAVVLIVLAVGQPVTIQAAPVSLAQYPKGNLEVEDFSVAPLTPFFRQAMAQVLSGSEGNNAFSPANLYMALALAAELTGGNSRQQILDALGAESQEALRAQARDFWAVCSRDDGHNITRLANSLWLNDSLSYHQEVMDTLANHYYTSVYQRDLSDRQTGRDIAAWIDQQTNGFLRNATQDISLPPETVLALYATVYFQAKWTDHNNFSPKNNTTAPFHSPDGDVDCTFMNQKELQTNYYWGEDYGAVALNLKGGSQMWFFLPDEGKTVDDILASGEYAKNPVQWENSKYMKVNLSVPKFDFTSQESLTESVKALGITEVFSPGKADFSPSIDGNVWFTAVNQATRVAADEEGVTAASYIELPGAGAAMPPEEIIDFVLDRPFLFLITNYYGIPLFAGVINCP